MSWLRSQWIAQEKMGTEKFITFHDSGAVSVSWHGSVSHGVYYSPGTERAQYYRTHCVIAGNRRVDYV